MKKHLKILTIAVCALFVATAFLPSGIALRGRPSGADFGITSNPISQSRIDAKSLVSASNSRINAAMPSKDEEFRARFDKAVSVLSNPTHFYDDDVPIDVTVDENFSNEVWIVAPVGKAMFYDSPRASLTRVSLAISSTSGRVISVCASVNASGVMSSIGLVTIKIQRYFKGRWMTVSTVTNEYNYNCSYFIYSAVRSNFTSGNYYRVTATFYGDNGLSPTTVTKTSQSIRCM